MSENPTASSSTSTPPTPEVMTVTLEMHALHSDVSDPQIAHVKGGSVATFSHLSYEVKGKDGAQRLVDDVSVKVGQGEVSASRPTVHVNLKQLLTHCVRRCLPSWAPRELWFPPCICSVAFAFCMARATPNRPFRLCCVADADPLPSTVAPASPPCST